MADQRDARESDSDYNIQTIVEEEDSQEYETPGENENDVAPVPAERETVQGPPPARAEEDPRTAPEEPSLVIAAEKAAAEAQAAALQAEALQAQAAAAAAFARAATAREATAAAAKKAHAGQGVEELNPRDADVQGAEAVHAEEPPQLGPAAVQANAAVLAHARVSDTAELLHHEGHQQQPGQPQPPRGIPAPQQPTGRQLPEHPRSCLLYTSPSPRDGLLSRMPSSA